MALYKEFIKNQFTIHHLLQVLKSLLAEQCPTLQNCLNRYYVFNRFLKQVKDGDLRKSNAYGSGFHSLGAHTDCG